MTRPCDLGPGDVWTPPDEPEFLCECGAVEEFGMEFCSADRCPQCCAEQGDCHLECQTCHRYVEADEFDTEEMATGECIDCQVAAMEAAEEDAERDLVALEAKGDEMRDDRC